jgi:hypothetical protein
MEPSIVSDEPCCSRNRCDNPERWPTNGPSNHRHFLVSSLIRAEIPHELLRGSAFTSCSNGVLDKLVYRTGIREGKARCHLFLVNRLPALNG